MTERTLIGSVAAVGLCLACGGGPASPSGSSGGSTQTGSQFSGPLVFTAIPVDRASLEFIVPLGNLNPPGHTLPSDHIYFYTSLFHRERSGLTVFSPGEGQVLWIIDNGTPGRKIGIRRGAYYFYLDHVVLDSGIAAGSMITSGQRMGTTEPGAFGFDLGVNDDARTVFFVNPARYPSETIHGDSPLKYFSEPLRSELYSMVQRIGSDKDGKFDFDVAGTLSGGWFLEGLPVSSSAGPDGWSRHLAFVRDNTDPSQIRIAIGGSLAAVGVFGIVGNTPDPTAVRVSTGKVVYNVGRAGAPGDPVTQVTGRVIAQLLDDQRIRVEYSSITTGVADFTTAARIYTR